MRLDNIRDQDMSCISAIYSHVYHCSYVVAFLIGNTKSVHQLCISRSYQNAVHLCHNTISADFLYICDTFLVNFLTVSSFQAAADRM